jgi:hypothetical protein
LRARDGLDRLARVGEYHIKVLERATAVADALDVGDEHGGKVFALGEPRSN